MRVYFPFDLVRQGLFDVPTKLYGVTYRPAKDAPVWHPSVEAFEMLRDGVVIGRFYLDLHPRPDKASNSAITMTVRSGARRELPELVLVASLPGGQPGDPGLMSHDDVRTFFHEFGHLGHFVLSGGHRWFGLKRRRARLHQAPSQMFEEWTWDPRRWRPSRALSDECAGSRRSGRADAAREQVRPGAVHPSADDLREAGAVAARSRSPHGGFHGAPA
jgi:thimet oligopeptidase